MRAMLATDPTPRRLHVGLDTEEDMRRFVLVATLGLIVLNACDLLLTRHLLATAHGREANPLMAPIIEGPWGYAVKIGIPAILALRHLTAPLYRRVVLGLGAVSVLYLCVVTWNFHLVLSRMG